MAREITSDLTVGPISSHLRSLAIPAAIGMLFNTLYNVVDMFFAGLLSTSAQAGISLGFQAFYIALSVGFGLGAAMGAIVGVALGRKDRRTARRLSAQGITFGFMAALVFLVIGAWYGPALIGLVSEPGLLPRCRGRAITCSCPWRCPDSWSPMHATASFKRTATGARCNAP